MNTKEILLNVKETLTGKCKITVLKRDAKGKPVKDGDKFLTEIRTVNRWCQEAAPQTGRSCLALALIQVAGWSDECIHAGNALREIAGTWSIAEWNDTEGRTLNEVHNLLDMAIAKHQ